MPTTAIREGRSRDFLARCPPRLGRVGIGLVELYAPEYRAPWQRESPGFERGSANHRRLAARDIQAAVGLKHSATSRWLACGRGKQGASAVGSIRPSDKAASYWARTAPYGTGRVFGAARRT